MIQNHTVKPAPVTPFQVLPAQPHRPHPAVGNMTDTKKLAKLARQCCEGIEQILAEPLNDQASKQKLEQLEQYILTNWPWLGFHGLLSLRHDIAKVVVS